MLRSSREDLRLVLEILNNASYTEEIGQRLHAIAAEFARIAGTLAWDCDQPAVSQRFHLAALRAAHLSGDRRIGAHILGFMSEQAWTSDPQAASRLAESALTGAKDLTPALAARLHSALALSAAAMGDAGAVNRAIGRMFELTAVIDPANEPPYIYLWSEPYAQMYAGWAFRTLDEPKKAETHYRGALGRLDPAFSRDRSLWLAGLGITQAQLHELEGACRSAGESAALARRLGSERVRTRLTEFRRIVQPHANSAPVKDFDTKFPDVLHTP